MKRMATGILAGTLLGAALITCTQAAVETCAALRNEIIVYVEGRRVSMEAYNIAGVNYVKLRDIGAAVGFNVAYDVSTGIISIGDPSNQVSDEKSRIVTLPADGSKYTPQVGDLIPCDDGTLYEVKNTDRFENNCFAPGPLPDLPNPTCDWSVFPTLELPTPEVRHFSDEKGDDLFVRNLYETRRMQYTIYNAIGRTPEAWRNGKPLAKIFLTIPAEYELYTPVFWPFRASEIEKQVAAIPCGRFRIEAWDYYSDHVFLDTRYFICTI